MNGKAACIARISCTLPIEGADEIELVMMEGSGKCSVSGKGEFSPGDLCVYLDEGCAVPASDERFSFLGDRFARKVRDKGGNVVLEVFVVRKIRIKGMASTGIVMKIGEFPEIVSRMSGDMAEIGMPSHDGSGADVLVPSVGADVSGLIGARFFSDAPGK